MLHASADRTRSNPLTRLFLITFVASCVLFWWLQSILLHFWLGMESPIKTKFLWISIFALLAFVLGYLVPVHRFQGRSNRSMLLDLCEGFAFKATLILAAPAFLVAVQFAYSRLGMGYQEGPGISLPQQAVLYTHLFFGFLFLGVVKDATATKRKVLLVSLLITFPRLIVSLQWGRFFVAQAIVPIIFIAIARGWISVSFKRMLQLCLIGLFILFVPALIRGDSVFGEDQQGLPQIVNYFGYMNSLGFFQDNTDLKYPCPPLLVSLTAKTIPYPLLGVCTTDVGEDRGITATVDRLLTREYSDDLRAGSGGNYLLELYLTGGVPAIIIGSILFGLSCRVFVVLLDHRSLYAGIWAECLSRALFAPRGTLGATFDRIPTLLLATWATILLSWTLYVLSSSAEGSPMVRSPRS